MGLRYRKSKKLGPVRLTLSKSGLGASIGVKGFRVTKTATGRVRTTASIPGTGISYVKETGGKRPDGAAKSRTAAAPPQRRRYTGIVPDIPENYDELTEEAARAVIAWDSASAAMLQRELQIGYSRAARLIDQLEELGIVGPYEGAKPRKVMITPGPSEIEGGMPETGDAGQRAQVSNNQKKKTPWGKLIIVLLLFGLLGSCVKGNPKIAKPEPSAAVATPTLSPTEKPVRIHAATAAPTPKPTPEIMTYVANKNTGKFHKPNCASVDDMQNHNKAVFETTRDEMIAMGFEPCGRCHP